MKAKDLSLRRLFVPYIYDEYLGSSSQEGPIELEVLDASTLFKVLVEAVSSIGLTEDHISAMVEIAGRHLEEDHTVFIYHDLEQILRVHGYEDPVRRPESTGNF